MDIWAFLTNHEHYWGVPHPRATDNKLIQVCYGCSRERECLDIRPAAGVCNVTT